MMRDLPPSTVVEELETGRVSLIILPHLLADLDRRAWNAQQAATFYAMMDLDEAAYTRLQMTTGVPNRIPPAPISIERGN